MRDPEGDRAHGEPADREAERLLEDFPLIRDAGEQSRQKRNGHATAAEQVIHLDDFVAYLPRHNYVFLPTREPWPATSVNARMAPIPLVDADGRPVRDDNGEQKFIAASSWLDKNRPVEQMTWAPGESMLIKDRLVAEGGWIERAGCTILNLYRPPNLKLGNAEAATPWLDHVRRIYPDDFDHIVRWLAHRVQRPAEKINHALALGGATAASRRPGTRNSPRATRFLA